MRVVKRIIILLIVSILMLSVLSFNPPVSTADSSLPIVKVLFIGNSKTFHNIFPRMYRNLAMESEKTDVRIKTIVGGGRSLQQHAAKLAAIHDSKGKVLSYKEVQSSFKHEDEYNAYLAAFKSDFKYVVLQAQKEEQKNYEKLDKASKKIIDLLREYGNKDIKVIYNAVWDQYPDTSVYTTFDEQMSQFEIEQGIVNQNFTKVAEETGGTVSYSGQAVYNYIKTYPDETVYSMYVNDLNHPTQAASYLSACCLYAAIHNESPKGISYYGTVKDVETNPILNLNYPASDSVHNGVNSKGRKALGDLNKTLVGKLQKTAEQTMIKNSPTISITKDIESLTNKSITLKANASDSAFGLDSSAYSWDGTNYSNKATFKVSNNGKYTVYVKNKIGKISSKSITINNIDKVAPTLTVEYSITKKTNQNVEVKITSNEKLQEVNGWTLSSDKKVLSRTYTSNISKTITVKDLAGNSSSAQVNIENIDKIAPTLTVKYNTTEKTNGNVKVTITSNEQIQEVDGWTLSSDKKILSKIYESNASKKITVKDLAGNSSSITVTVSNIDKTVPTLTVKYSTTEKTNGNVKVTITSNEQIQEVDGWTLSSDKKVLNKTFESNKSETLTVKDLVGNSKIVTVTLTNIDKTPPALTVKYSTTEKTNGNVNVTITSNEQIQEVTGWTLSSDKKVLNKTYEANGNEKVTVKDLAGNSSSVEVKVANIDKTAPALTVKYSTTEKTNGNVNVTITSNEQIQAVTGWTLSSDKKVLNKTYEANGNEKVTVKDLAGNSSSVEVKVANIDKTAPTLKVEYSTTNKTNGNVEVTIKSNEQLQAVTGWSLSIDKLSLTKVYTQNTSGQETIIVKDIAGNESKAIIEITNIHKLVTITSNRYKLQDKTVYDIKPQTTVNDIKNNISADKDYSIIKQDGSQIKDTDIVGTGYRIRFSDGEEYKLIINGDLDGNGKITITDLVKIKKHIVGKEYLKDVYEKAGDISNNQKISITDLAKMKKIIVGLENI